MRWFWILASQGLGLRERNRGHASAESLCGSERCWIAALVTEVVMQKFHFDTSFPIIQSNILSLSRPALMSFLVLYR
jgi:hypothetical protein